MATEPNTRFHSPPAGGDDLAEESPRQLWRRGFPRINFDVMRGETMVILEGPVPARARCAEPLVG